MICEALITQEQCGFRKGRSCNDNVFMLNMKSNIIIKKLMIKLEGLLQT